MKTQHNTILVVDDDEIKRYTMIRTLRQAGYQIVEGVSGEDALRLAREGPSLIILDVKLPDLDGFEVCRRLKADPATWSIPILHLSTTFIRPESRVLGLESGADAYLTETSEPTVLVATVRALLRLRRAEESAQSLASEWAATFDAITDGVFLLDRAGQVTRCNRALGALLNRPIDALIGRPVGGLHADLPGSGQGSPYDEAFATSRRASAEIRAGGRWFRLTVDPVADSSGRVTGAVGILTDVTPQKRAEESLREADRKKDEFLAMLAHELRNPLAPLRSGLQILEKAESDPRTAVEAREMMERQVGHLGHLIDDLLDLSRVSQGKIELRKRRVPLDEIVRQAVESCRAIVTDSGHSVSVLLPEEPVAVFGDAVRLTQIVANLLNNAAKYTDPGGRITVTAERVGREAVIRVRDTGIGIEPEMLESVFDLFTQADKSSARSQGGLGVGLKLVRTLTEMHGGNVRAVSAGTGQGSEFIVRLPLYRERDSSASPEVESPTGRAGTLARRLRLLVVDDNLDAARSLSMLLRMVGHEVFVAYDGPGAVAAVQEHRPEVVLLDIGLPHFDGNEVARRLRESPELKDIFLVALTGWGQPEDRRRSKEAGFDEHLVKPVDIDQLQDLLARLPQPDSV